MVTPDITLPKNDKSEGDGIGQRGYGREGKKIGKFDTEIIQSESWVISEELEFVQC